MELLSPCHDLATLKAAVAAGADAVYFGVQTFNMRLKAGNFRISELPDIVSYCHEYGVRAYLTTNVVVYEDELGEIKELLINARDSGIDAVIVHDLAVLRMARELGLGCHVSTQANISNSIAVNQYADLGADRVILSRELSLNQLREVINNSKIPVEVFIHGSMCVSISGRCFFSQLMYQKHANRGECYQPCRQKWMIKNEDGELIYDGKRFLNSKDLCMIEHVPELLTLGVDCFKIEGRMKDANYVSTVTRVYKEALSNFSEDRLPYWKKKLSSVFNRGFCTGFYFNEPEETPIPGNQSIIKKVFVGEVKKYYRKSGVAEVLLKAGGLSLGDEVIFSDSEGFHKQVIDSMEVNHEQVNKVSKGERVGVKVSERVRKGLSVYKLVSV